VVRCPQLMRSWPFVVGVVLLLAILLLLLDTKRTQAHSTCRWERYEGIATTVGPTDPASNWRYPWETVLRNRLDGRAARGSIRDDATMADFPNPVALRAVMDDHSILGKHVLIHALDGAHGAEFAQVLDAMAGELGTPGNLGWEPGVNYRGRVADLTPEAMTRLAGWHAPSLDVEVWIPYCP